MKRMKSLKQWRMEEADRLGCSETTVAMRMTRGGYPDLKLVKVNARVIYVDEAKTKRGETGSMQKTIRIPKEMWMKIKKSMVQMGLNPNKDFSTWARMVFVGYMEMCRHAMKGKDLEERLEKLEKWRDENHA